MLPSTAQALGFFNLLVGLMLVASILSFFGGFVMYLVRLGTWPTYREEAVKLMRWGVAILFTLVILLAIQQFLARHIMVAVSGVALVIIALVVWAVIQDLAASPPPAKPER